MQKTQAVLAICIIVLLGMIFYSNLSGHDLGWLLKGWIVVCVVVYFIRLFIMYRGKRKD